MVKPTDFAAKTPLELQPGDLDRPGKIIQGKVPSKCPHCKLKLGGPDRCSFQISGIGPMWFCPGCWNYVAMPRKTFDKELKF